MTTFGEMAFGDLTFSKMTTIGEMTFGEVTLGKMYASAENQVR